MADELNIICEDGAAMLLGRVSKKVLRRMVREGDLPSFYRLHGPRGGLWANRIHFIMALRKRFLPLGLKAAV